MCTDHKLVRGKMKLRIKKKFRDCGTKVPRRIDVSKLQDSDVSKILKDAFESIPFDGT